MSRLALRNKTAAKPKFKTQGYHRCGICGRVRWVLATIQDVQNLLPASESEGRNSRGQKIQLVGAVAG